MLENTKFGKEEKNMQSAQKYVLVTYLDCAMCAILQVGPSNLFLLFLSIFQQLAVSPSSPLFLTQA